MTKRLLLGMWLGLSAFSIGLRAQTTNRVERPRLVVGVVIDQMRWDYLYRYYDRYGEGGFKRLLREGFACENTQIGYVPTVTALGHTCIYTGSVPAIHGIAGNDFIFEREGRETYCTDDADESSVGTDSDTGKMSPRNLLVSTVTDELRLATNFRSKTIGIALKDRGSILPAGHTANAAYWFDDQTGRWITSTYYMNRLPAWVEAFNRQDRAAALLQQDWHTLYPIETYTESTPDDTRYEEPFEAGEKPVMPIRTSELLRTEGYSVIRTTPYGTTLTLELAKAAITGEQLGQDADTDFLAVSLSSTDYIGHRFGVNAVETEDTYLRLDNDLADFMAYLDEAVGKDCYTLFLTADHAAAHNVRFMCDHHLPAGVWRSSDTRVALDSLVAARFGIEGAIRSVMNYQIHLDEPKLAAANVDREAVKRAVITYLQSQSGMAYVIDTEHVAEATIPAVIRERIINGYCPGRSGVIQVILQPGWYEIEDNGEALGTSHAVWCPYDSHIPLLFAGWGICQGKTYRKVDMTDIAATISALLRIQMPSGCIGTPIEEALE